MVKNPPKKIKSSNILSLMKLILFLQKDIIYPLAFTAIQILNIFCFMIVAL